MTISKRFFAVTVAAFTVGVVTPGPARGAAPASDNACNTGYSGAGDWTGNNGGSGFGAWSKTIAGGGLFKRGSSGVNDNNSGAPTIDASCSGSFSWGMNAGGNAGNTALVTRVFTAGSTPSASLQAGQIFSIDMDNGYVDSPGYAGFSLQNSSGQDVFAFQCLPSAGYYTNGASTGIGYTGHGLRLIFTMTSTNACTLQVLNPNTSTTTNTYTNVGLLNPAGGQAISQVALYARACGGGNSSENNHDLYFNTMSISCAPFTATVPNANACPGSTATFTVSTSAASTLTYQWQVSTNGGVAWNPVSTGTGGTTVSYTTATTTVGDNGKMFRCLLTDVCGDIVTSSAGTLSILSTGPSIIVEPTGQGACSSATFTVTASNAVSYLWYKGPTGSGVALGNGGSISGATTPALTLSGLLPGDNGANFYVVVSGCGTPQTSSGAVLTINVPPSITGEPASATVCAGASTNFTVTATGMPLNYAWRKRGTGWGANSWTLNAGGGGFFIGDSSSNGNGSSGNINTFGKSWGLSNATASSVTEAIRTFPTPLQVGQQFQIDMDNGYVTSGNEVGLSLRNASGNIVWELLYVGGNSGSYYTINDSAGTNNIAVTYTDGGLRIILTLTSPTNYSATVETSPVSIGNSTTYGPYTGTLKSTVGGSVPAQVRLWNDNGNGAANYGLFFNSMIVNGVDDDNAVAYNNSTWAAGQTPNFGDVALSDGGSISGSATPSLTLTGVSTNDSGANFDCVVTGGTSCGGNIPSSVATLTVYADTGMCILQQPGGVPAYTGGSASFTVVAQGLSYQWYKGATGGGVALSNGGSVSGATTPTLTLSGLTLADSGANFYVVVGCCGGSMEPSAGAGLSVTAAPDGFLKANGLNVRNGHGTGDIVPLHGANLGAWLLMEGWMCPMDTSGLPYFLAVVQTLDSRFGTNTEESLIRTYQDTWIMANDLDNIKAMGMNMVRVPIMWTDLQKLDDTWRTDAYDRIDWVVSNAWQRGIYTLIDLHGVPGGVAVTQSAGTEDNAYWTNTADQVQTAMIWSNLATHFLGNPAVAGYDLINEPYGAPTQQALWDMYNNLYQVVRPLDPDHIIMMEATWKGTATNGVMLNWVWDVLPPPTRYGWSNVVYSLHEYHFEDTTDVGPIETGMVNQVIDFDNHKIWNVPDYIGEFNMFTPGTGTDPQTAWQFGMQLLNTNGINWTVWSYKSTHGDAPDSWGLYDFVGTPPPTPNLATDTVATISNDWSECGTVPGFGINPLLQVSLGGPLAISDLYTTTAGTPLSVNSSSGVLANDVDINLGQPGIHLTAVLVNGPTNGVLTLNADGSFSYTPNMGFTGTDTFRYQVNDGYATSVNIGTVVIEVNPAGPPSSAFQAWQVQYFGSTTNLSAAPNADPYGKGISNTNQFLLGLNPTNPASMFEITSEAPQGQNVVITWKTAGVRTNALQAASGSSYGTNGFADISGPIIINVTGDTTTNYTDSGGATNRPARYYRIRLVP